jgi:hypothetical protein
MFAIKLSCDFFKGSNTQNNKLFVFAVALAGTDTILHVVTKITPIKTHFVKKVYM